MLKAMVTTAILAVSLTVVSVSSADNYGGVSPQTRAQVTKEVYRYWSGWQARTMLRCIQRESGFNPRAVNWGDSNGGSHGLAQINGVHRSTFGALWSKRYTISGGIEMAYRLYRADGFGPWGGGC